jgi:hypothetical protein
VQEEKSLMTGHEANESAYKDQAAFRQKALKLNSYKIVIAEMDLRSIVNRYSIKQTVAD